jgi:hypothetical protein
MRCSQTCDVAMVDSLRPYNLNLPGLNNEYLPSPSFTRIWPILWETALHFELRTSSSMCREAMFNWNQRSKRILETEANPSLPIGNEIGTPSRSAQIIAKLLQRLVKLIEAISQWWKVKVVSNVENWSYIQDSYDMMWWYFSINRVVWIVWLTSRILCICRNSQYFQWFSISKCECIFLSQNRLNIACKIW